MVSLAGKLSFLHTAEYHGSPACVMQGTLCYCWKGNFESLIFCHDSLWEMCVYVQIASMKFCTLPNMYRTRRKNVIAIHLYSVCISKSSLGLEIPAFTYLSQLPCIYILLTKPRLFFKKDWLINRYLKYNKCSNFGVFCLKKNLHLITIFFFSYYYVSSKCYQDVCFWNQKQALALPL